MGRKADNQSTIKARLSVLQYSDYFSQSGSRIEKNRSYFLPIHWIVAKIIFIKKMQKINILQDIKPVIK